VTQKGTSTSIPGRPLLHALAWGLLAVVLSFAVWGPTATLATAAGVVGTTGYLGGTWAVIWAMGRTYDGKAMTAGQMLILTFALLLKFPLILLAWKGANSLGPTGPTGFLVGLASVYCALIGWAVVTARTT